MSEKDLDEAFRRGLKESHKFRSWFLAKLVHGHGYEDLVFIRSDNPWCRMRVILPDAISGALTPVERDSETDVLAVFENSAGKRLGVHVENKIASGNFTPHQPEMYAARAEHWTADSKYGSYDSWETVLLAPTSFVDRNATEVRKFTTRITHEEVSAVLPGFVSGGDK